MGRAGAVLTVGGFQSSRAADMLPSGRGSGTEPAIIAHALEAFGQHMLQETTNELLSGHGQVVPLLVLTIFVAEGDLGRSRL